MSEGDGFFRRMLNPRAESMPTVDTHRAKGLFGAIDSYGNRRAAERFEKEMTAADRAYSAATSLQLAREEYRRVSSRMTAENFELIAMQEAMRVKEEFLNQQLRLAEAEKQKQHFELKAQAEEARLRADLMQAKLAEKRAEQELYGISSNMEEKTSEKRARLQTEIEEVTNKISELQLEHAQKVAADELDIATEQRLQSQINSLVEKRDRLQAELDES